MSQLDDQVIMTKLLNWFCIFHRFTFAFLSIFGLVACTTRSNTNIQRIALIAPFEGRYSEIGYDAYYAVQLAIKEHQNNQIELLAIDDGGSVSTAVERANAITNDPLINVVIVLGNNATQPQAQQAFEHLPVIIVGQWHTKPTSENVYMLASKQLESVQTAKVVTLEEAAQVKLPIVGGEIFALSQFPLLSKNFDNVTIASNASLPNTEFRQRYLTSGQYVPEPGMLASLTYDAAGIALEALQNADPNKAIGTMTYKGLNGDIQFVNGYWGNAPVYFYRYDSNGRLTAEDQPIK